MKTVSFEIDSPELTDFGQINDTLRDGILDVAAHGVRKPTYIEDGRLTWRVRWEEDANNTALHELSEQIAQTYLGYQPAPGSVVTVNTITDIEAFRRSTMPFKVASKWHQDSMVIGSDSYFLPDDIDRLIVPFDKGPLAIVGRTAVINAVPFHGGIDARAQLMRAGPIAVGADGVLLKSETRPPGGELVETLAEHVYGPGCTVHKTHPDTSEGRIFYQLDSIKSRGSDTKILFYN